MKLASILSTAALSAALVAVAAPAAHAQQDSTRTMQQDSMMMMQDTMQMMQDTMMMRQDTMMMMQDSTMMMQDSMMMRQNMQMQDTSMMMQDSMMRQNNQMQNNQPQAGPMGGQSIVAVASASQDFEMLVQAVQTAGLASTLDSGGPYTVFAPTDAAFDQVPASAMAGLQANPDELREVLTYHVVSGELSPTDLQGREYLETMSGERLPVRSEGGTLYVGNARIVAEADASNGVIYAIDTVLMPPEEMTK